MIRTNMTHKPMCGSSIIKLDDLFRLLYIVTVFWGDLLFKLLNCKSFFGRPILKNPQKLLHVFHRFKDEVIKPGGAISSEYALSL